LIRVWRLVPRSRGATAFSGDGGLLVDGRWHRRGRRVVYCSSSEAAARLEVLAHCASPHLLPPHVRIAAEIPEDGGFEDIEEAELPAAWDRPPPYLPDVQSLGDAWLRRGESLCLRVPSALSPSDRHLLINPLHPAMGRVVVGPAEPCAFDRRIASLRR